jgi:hypothetical protein
MEDATIDESTYGTSERQFKYMTAGSIPSLFSPNIRDYDLDNGGFFESISSDALFARQSLDLLKKNGWIDPVAPESHKTIILSLTLLNTNYRLYEWVNIIFQISALGDWKSAIESTTFPVSMTPSIFTTDSTELLALYILLCVFLVSLIVYLSLEISISHKKLATIWQNGILLLITLILIGIVIQISVMSFRIGNASMSSQVSFSTREAAGWATTPFEYLTNAGKLSYQMNILRSLFGINLFLVYFDIVLRIGGVIYLPSTRMILVASAFIVCFGASVQLVLNDHRGFADTTLFTLFSVFGMVDWSGVSGGLSAGTIHPIGALITIIFYLLVLVVCPMYLWAGIAHKMIHNRETVESASVWLDTKLSDVRSSVKSYYERNFFDKYNEWFKKYFPGFYYRVIIEDRRFENRVKRAITKKSIKRDHRAGFVATVDGSNTIDGEIDSSRRRLERNVSILNDAITNIHERLNQLSDGLGGEIDCLPEKIQEIKRYITVLDWNIK